MLYFYGPMGLSQRHEPRGPYVKAWPPGTDDDKPGETRRVRELREEVERLALLNQALWELLREKMGLSDEALAAQAGLVDRRGDQQPALRCPACDRVSSARHAKCLYCGQLFERPLF